MKVSATELNGSFGETGRIPGSQWCHTREAVALPIDDWFWGCRRRHEPFLDGLNRGVDLRRKSVPRRASGAPVFGAVLIALGLWIAIAPTSVPGLHSPAEKTDMPGMKM